MDKTARRNILLGFFVLIGLILFIVGIFLVGAKSEMFRKTFPISARFSNATGLKPGSNIRYNGVKVGIVKTVTLLNDTAVLVDMRIEESRRAVIRTTAIASIASDGLMGDKMVNIVPGKIAGDIIKDNDVITGQNPINMEQVLLTLSRSNENIKVITDNLKTLTSDIVSGQGVAQSLYKDTMMVKNLKHSFANLDGITARVLGVSQSLQQLTDKVKDGNGILSEIINDSTLADNLSATLDKLKTTADDLSTASKGLSSTVQKASTVNGPLNMLLTDTALSADVRQSMGNIKKASAGLNENMEALKHNFLTRRYFRKMEKKQKKSLGN